MSLTVAQISKVAKLANIPITKEEESQYQNQLSKVIDYIDQLNDLSTDDVEPTYNISENTNITRLDSVSTSLTQDEALGNASQVKGGLFVTKGVFKE